MSLEEWIILLIHRILSLILRRKLSSLIEIDLKTFPPCHGKEIPVWEWKHLKWMKYVVHVSKEGKITVEKLL